MKGRFGAYAARAERVWLAIVLWGALAVGAHASGPALAPLPERAPAPGLRLADLDGKRWDLAELRGKVVLVNFWATWCPPCRREMPSLERLWAKLKRDDFVVLAVNVGESPDTVFAFTGELDPAPTFPLLFDRDSGTLKTWPVRGLPTTFVVDRSGRLAFRAIGGREFDHPAIVAELQRLLDSR